MIDIVGIGLDGKAGLTEKVQKIVEEATLLVGSDRHLSYFPDHPAEKIVLGDFLQAIEQIRQHHEVRGSPAFERRGLSDSQDYSIVILVSGDPLFFGLGRLLLEHFSAEQLCFHPHLCSVQLAFNKIKIPWQDACIISLHGRSLNELISYLQPGHPKLAILTDGKNNPSAIARLYLSLDLPTYYDFWICENLEGNPEKITCYKGQEIETLASLPDHTFALLNLVILLQQEDNQLSLDLNKLPVLGLPDRTFLSFKDRPGLMTKKEIRLMILGELELQNNQMVWDIGAGTGSVSIEIARLCPTSQVYAIEKTAMGVTLIQQNCQRFQVSNLIPIQGNAPAMLSDLPNPNRIFIGGSGGSLIEILEVCQRKLMSDGLLVIALATLENLGTSLEWFKTNNWNYNLIEVQISRSVPINKLTRFSPLNPVILIQAKPFVSIRKLTIGSSCH